MPNKNMKRAMLYIVQLATGPIKIGMAQDPQRRLRAIRAANPYDPRLIHSIAATYEDERRLLNTLESEILTGEWVGNSPIARQTIDSFFGFRLHWQCGLSPRKYQKRILAARRMAIKDAKWESLPVRIKTVRRQLADGTLKAYSYKYRGSRRVDDSGNPSRLSKLPQGVPPARRSPGPQKRNLCRRTNRPNAANNMLKNNGTNIKNV